MKEIKAFIRENRDTEIVESLRDNDFLSTTLSEVEGQVDLQQKKGCRP